MPRKPKNDLHPAEADLDGFDRQVEQALDHFADPDWLGDQSPLAAPYFLGQTAPISVAENARTRGLTFQQIVRNLADNLDPELKQVLYVAYLARNPNLDNVGLAMSLNMAERTYYRARQKAIKSLAYALHGMFRPPLRPEMPAMRTMVGRTTHQEQALAALARGGSVYISGPSGVGKTTLGANVALYWLTLLQDQPAGHPNHRVFWYTLRRNFNDQVTSFLFALGYFLRGLGAGNLWRQIVADRGSIDMECAVGLLRHDIETLKSTPPLFCIDDVDVLLDDSLDHVQIAHLLEQLSTCAALLLMGQRNVLQSTLTILLDGLSIDAVDAIFQEHGVTPPTADLRERVVTYTRGIPALIHLLAALAQSGEELDVALPTLPKAPSTESLFHRIWRRLTQPERALTLQLAVFRSSTPADAWFEAGDAYASLLERGLIMRDDLGGVHLFQHIQRHAQEMIPPDMLPPLHLKAAELRTMRGEHIHAMYHFIHARFPSQAVWTWFTHRHDEIEHGRGAAALALLHNIALADLNDETDRNALRISRSELLVLAGQPDEAEQDLSTVVMAPHGSASGYVLFTKGRIAEMQGRIEQALQHYRNALDALSGHPRQHEVVAHSRLGFLQLYRLHDLPEARRQALLARAKADAFLGDIAAINGDYQAALSYLESALQSAEENGRDLGALSRINSYLGALHARLGNYAQALDFSTAAIACDRSRGDVVSPLYDMLNRATVLTFSGRYEEAHQEAGAGLAEAERLRNPYLIAGLAASVAEAHVGMEQFAEAEHFAHYSLSQEEEFFRAPACIVLGQVRQHQGRDMESLAMMQAALESARAIDDRSTEAGAWRALGKVQLQMNQTTEATKSLDQALTIYRSLHLPHEIAATQSLLAQCAS